MLHKRNPTKHHYINFTTFNKNLTTQIDFSFSMGFLFFPVCYIQFFDRYSVASKSHIAEVNA